MDIARSILGRQPTSTSVAPRRTLLPLEESSGKVPPGSLLISDVFSSGPSESHGIAVTKAAWSVGFSGPVFYQQAVGRALAPLQEHFKAAEALESSPLSKQTVQAAFRAFVVGPPLHMLESGIDEVDRAYNSQASNSALNLSSGMSKAQVASLLYERSSQAWKSDEPQTSMLGTTTLLNLAQLFPIDLKHLTADDSETTKVARHQFQQTLIHEIDKVWDGDLEIQNQKERFSESVRRFESRRNSVVVAAGNEGLIKPLLEMETGQSLEVPSDFEQNVLECEDVTSVGASIILNGVESPARYSNNFPGIDFYTSGDVTPGFEFDDSQGMGQTGTSLAAPRVSALLAKLHGDFPTLSSSRVENLLKSRISTDEAPIIQTPTAQEFLLTDSSWERQ